MRVANETSPRRRRLIASGAKRAKRHDATVRTANVAPSEIAASGELAPIGFLAGINSVSPPRTAAR